MWVCRVCDNRSINYRDNSVHTNEASLGQNQCTESNLVNDYIDVDIVLKKINYLPTRNDDVLETVNENAGISFIACYIITFNVSQRITQKVDCMMPSNI